MNNNADKFGRFLSRYRKLRAKSSVLIGRIAIAYFQEHFRLQGFRDGSSLKRWKPRRHSDGRALLVQTGKLKRDARIATATQNRVVINWGGSLPGDYAKVQNEGGEITITKKMRRYFWAQYFQTNDPKWKAMALTKGTTITIPKRQFIGDSKGLVTRLDRYFARQIKRELNRTFR